jgi:hypothetical protein
MMVHHSAWMGHSGGRTVNKIYRSYDIYKVSINPKAAKCDKERKKLQQSIFSGGTSELPNPRPPPVLSSLPKCVKFPSIISSLVTSYFTFGQQIPTPGPDEDDTDEKNNSQKDITMILSKRDYFNSEKT